MSSYRNVSWKRGAQGIVTRLLQQDKREGGYFSVAVDPDALGLPTYFDVIKNPMDLGTVKENLLHGAYEALEDFIADVQLIWDNAREFNGPTHFVSAAANRLQKMFEKEIEKSFKKIKCDESDDEKDEDVESPSESAPRPKRPQKRKGSIEKSTKKPKKKEAEPQPQPGVTYEDKFEFCRIASTLPEKYIARLAKLVYNHPHVGEKSYLSVDMDNGLVDLDVDKIPSAVFYDVLKAARESREKVEEKEGKKKKKRETENEN